MTQNHWFHAQSLIISLQFHIKWVNNSSCLCKQAILFWTTARWTSKISNDQITECNSVLFWFLLRSTCILSAHVKQADMLDRTSVPVTAMLPSAYKSLQQYKASQTFLPQFCQLLLTHIKKKTYLWFSFKEHFFFNKKYTLKEIWAVLSSLFRIPKMILVHGCLQRDYVNHNILEVGRNLKNHLGWLSFHRKSNLPNWQVPGS